MRAFFAQVRRVVLRFIEDDCATKAASIAYFALAGLFPGILLMLTVLGHVFADPQVQERLVEVVAWYIPLPGMRTFVTSNLHGLEEWGNLMSVLGVLLLMWSSKGTFLAAQHSLTTVWRMERVHHTVTAYLMAMFATLGLGLLLILQFSFIAFLRTAVTWEIKVPGVSLVKLSLISNTLSLLVSPLMLFSIFYLLYAYLPAERMPTLPICLGAGLATLAYRTMESGFIYYVTYISRLAVIYGAASTFIVLALWMYLSANIFLLGAEIAYVFARPEEP